MSVAELAGLPGDCASRRLVERYLERRAVVASGANAPAQAHETAFFDARGAMLDADVLGDILRALRRVGVTAQFNSALCRGLLAARYGDAAAPQAGIVPVHFVSAGDWKETVEATRSGNASA